jgi:tetratricopeptide (TPR) repeat protein
MPFFEDLFGTPKPSHEPAPPHADPSQDPNFIRVFDSYGREVYITREDWKEKVLNGAIQKDWNDAERLSSLIIQSLRDKFFDEMIEPAEHLREIDPDKERGAILLGVVYLNTKRIDDAERVLTDYIHSHAETGPLLTNLAKVYSAQGHESRAQETLWRGLEIDPNQDNGLAWYEAAHREKDGADAGQQALRRVATLTGSWRAQLWLARSALQSRQLEKALEYYNESLARAGTPVPADLLTQMSGDLGNTGHLVELISLTEPHFDIHLHGLQVGNNLIKAHLDLGQIDQARAIVEALYALKRPDWNKTLSYWDTEIAKTRVASEPVAPAAPLNMAMLRIEGPVWLKPTSPATELFRAKPSGAPLICFLGSSAETPSPGEGIQRQMADAPGRLSRALPLFMAEQIFFSAEAQVQTLVPWITDELPGFVLSGKRWEDEEAAAYARADGVQADYIIISHLIAASEPWTVDLHLVRAIDGKRLAVLSANFISKQPEAAIPTLARQLVNTVIEQAELRPDITPASYHVPTGIQFPFYLLHLEQLLAARCGTMEGVPKDFLSGEREIVNGNIQLCLGDPKNLPTRLILLQTFAALVKVRPELIPEFREKLTLLQKDKPLPEPANSIAQRMLNEILG